MNWIGRDLSSWATDGFGKLVVVRQSDERILGRVGLTAWDPVDWSHSTRAEIGTHAEIELGWTLLRDAWGSGYATEAAAAVRDFAFGNLSHKRLISLIHPDNVRSQRVAARLGETHERDVVTAGGHPAQLWAVSAGAAANAATELDRERQQRSDAERK